MLEQYHERVVPVIVLVLYLDLFNEIGENGSVVLLSVMLRDLLPAGARKKLCLESGICDIQPVSKSVFFVAASLEECFADYATAAKVDKAAKHVHCRGEFGVQSWIPRYAVHVDHVMSCL